MTASGRVPSIRGGLLRFIADPRKPSEAFRKAGETMEKLLLAVALLESMSEWGAGHWTTVTRQGPSGWRIRRVLSRVC